ncbi:hypothetical protein VP01_1828g7 [Puccinia sorghi]|uniref:Uncharacterized protein n=1 Tax=Puccinia sorghi TaxID=27349 RepID=A0A0L6VE05_9BASI|nr:hypothetical protein VP01_1828g7 [Puccinia sorghi]
MNPWETANSTSSHAPPNQQDVVGAAVQARTEHLESMISILANEIRSLKASNNTPTTTSQTNTQGSTTKPRANANIQDKPAKKTARVRKSTPAPEPPLPAPTVTPKRSVRASTAPPELTKPKPRNLKSVANLKLTKVPSPKRHPQQMQKGDFPPDFATTKNALYIHVKVLWGLLKQDSVPPAPDLQRLREFYERFSSNEQVEKAANVASSPALIDSNEVQLFKTARAGSVRYGRQVLHVGSHNIRYAQGLMVRLGLRVWCPNLEEDSGSLYNAAHRIAAITTFQELVAGNAYTYLNVNPKMANNIALLIQAYNHFVHYVLLLKYQKEQKQNGKIAQEAEHKRISKNRERLRDARKEYAVINHLPKRYQDIIAHIGAHSDDEYDEKNKVYKIKTLPYRSNNANKFFRALDLCMLRQASACPGSNRKRHWYHALPDSQQKLIPNTEQVAFLPNAEESLQPKATRHADEKLSNKSFTRKYWEILVEPYGLLNEDSSDGSGDEESNDNRNNAGENSEGEGHNLDDPSPDQSEDEYFEEGEAGDLYEDSGISHDEDTDGDDEYTGERSEEEAESDAEMEGMDSGIHGVDPALLARMEEEEDGW